MRVFKQKSLNSNSVCVCVYLLHSIKMKLLEVHSVEGNMTVNAIINSDVCLTLEKNAIFLWC